MKSSNNKSRNNLLMTRIPLWALIIAIPLFQSCNDDDDPVPENEEELITTLTMTFTNTTDATDVVTAQFRDLDGDGGNAPVIMNPTLTSGATYDAVIECGSTTHWLFRTSGERYVIP